MKQLTARRVSLILLLTGARLMAQDQGSCVTCHLDTNFFDEDRIAIVREFESDVHARVGLSCHDCHGGNADRSVADDFTAAMDADFKPNPYLGSPARTEIPSFCGRCHSDAVYMRDFRPDIRVDQEQEYWTSYHGVGLKSGDTKVATCTDCHGVHGILGANESSSPVFPKNVAQTCARCHADSDLMAGYTLPSGDPLPVDQLLLWQASVHGKALLEKQQLSAPTCNDCHGNHGATPPGVQSISFVCGHCHGREAQLFRESVKHEGFQTHNEFIADAGADACEACHSEDPNIAALSSVSSFSECATCHGNHGVMRPTLAMLGRLPETPCEYCHEPTRTGEASVLPGGVAAYQKAREELLNQANTLSLSGEGLYNWFLDRTLELPDHRVPGFQENHSQLRPEFAALFEKLRIGKSVYQLGGGGAQEKVDHRVVQCGDCHTPGSGSSADEVAGFYLDRFRELSLQIAYGERTLLRAKRGGVETGNALMEIDSAVDAQIELQVLLHTFSTDEGSAFVEKYESGHAHAEAGQAAGLQALEELAFRYKGLGIALIFILLILLALGAKIRQIDSEGQSARGN